MLKLIFILNLFMVSLSTYALELGESKNLSVIVLSGEDYSDDCECNDVELADQVSDLDAEGVKNLGQFLSQVSKDVEVEAQEGSQ